MLMGIIYGNVSQCDGHLLQTVARYFTPVIETEVHQRLRAYLREQGHTQWPHYLTMARLVARALRVGRSALMQIDSLAAYQGSHRLSYLIPAMLWPEPAILALPEKTLERVLHQDIPNLQQGLPVVKSVQAGSHWPGITSPMPAPPTRRAAFQLRFQP
jgi:ATP-dependent DNA helicase DinG